MNVSEVMTAAPEACRPDDNLSEAVALLWNADCGALPVTDHAGHVAGILTDRDICIALGTRNIRASEADVSSVMQTNVHTCQPTEDVLSVLARMGERRVRRMPVVDTVGRLVGVLSINDVVLAAGARNGVRPAAVLDALKGIFAHPLPVPVNTSEKMEQDRTAAPSIA
jgi:CBS domain-containing protein